MQTKSLFELTEIFESVRPESINALREIVCRFQAALNTMELVILPDGEGGGPRAEVIIGGRHYTRDNLPDELDLTDPQVYALHHLLRQFMLNGLLAVTLIDLMRQDHAD